MTSNQRQVGREGIEPEPAKSGQPQPIAIIERAPPGVHPPLYSVDLALAVLVSLGSWIA
jgi:hypothetical protein